MAGDLLMTQLIGVQRRMMRLGKVRLGEKGERGEPRKLSTFRFTSASESILTAVAETWGGSVRPWVGAPEEGYYEVTTEATELPIVLPPVFADLDGTPTLPYSQSYELWSAGGIQRRCDGGTESLTGKPCLCVPHARECKLTTRLNFMLPQIPGLGVWLMESHGYNAAAELPATLDLLIKAGQVDYYIDAVLRLENRTSKADGQTRRFVVPVIDLPGLRLAELTGGPVSTMLNAPSPRPPKPELPPGPGDPENAPFENDKTPDFGEAIGLLPGEEFEQDRGDEIVELQNELLGLAGQLYVIEATKVAIDANMEKNIDDMTKHMTWLRGQITRARNSLEAKQ